jgi:hypothetical protein
MRRELILEKIEETPCFFEDVQKAIYDIRLFNLKLSYVNKLFSLGLGYNQERKQEIIRQFDLMQGIEEVKLLYYTYRMEFYRDINARING